MGGLTVIADLTVVTEETEGEVIEVDESRPVSGGMMKRGGRGGRGGEVVSGGNHREGQRLCRRG